MMGIFEALSNAPTVTLTPFASASGRTPATARSMACYIDGTQSERKLPTDDTRHVEHVLDESCLSARVAFNHLESAVDLLRELPPP